MVLRLPRTIIVLSVLLGTGSLAVTSGGSGSSAEPSSRKGPQVTIRDLRFHGFGRDVVGRERSARPNGERDAHFSVVLAAGGSRSVVGLTLDRCDPGLKTKVCNQRKTAGNGFALASTTPVPIPFPNQPQAALLAVFRGGKRLNIVPGNKRSWLRLPGSAKRVRLDLYVNDGPGCIPSRKPPRPRCLIDRRFAPGQQFRVSVRSAPSQSRGPWMTIAGPRVGPTTRPVALRGVRYLGLGQDVVGRTPGSPPNGEPDAHWSIDVATPTGPVHLWGVHLERDRTDPSEPVPWIWTVEGGAWSSGLAVFLGEKRLKLEDGDPQHCGTSCGPEPENFLDLRWSPGTVRLDMYANDRPPGAFKPGRRFRVIVLAQMPRWVGAPGTRATIGEWQTLSG